MMPTPMTLCNMREKGVRLSLHSCSRHPYSLSPYKLSHFRNRIWISRVPLRAGQKWVLTQKVAQSKAPRP